MSFFLELPHPGIRELKPYKPGKSAAELRQERQLESIIKLASNENPFGVSPKAMAAISQMNRHDYAVYPSAVLHPLRHKLAAQLGIADNEIMLSNGTDYVIWFLLTTFALGGKKSMLTHKHAFGSYAIQAQTQNIPVRIVPTREDYTVCLDSMLQAIDVNTSIIFLAQPNNPTGIPIEEAALADFIDKVPDHIIIALDEAYYEFAYPKGSQFTLNLRTRHPNLVLFRTFSKAYGLAALRLGYLIAHPDIIDLMVRVQPPFTVNQLAMNAAFAALDDDLFLEQTLENNQIGIKQLQVGLNKLGLKQLPTATNFVTFDTGRDGMDVFDALLDKGIIVRPLVAYEMPNFLRVSAGMPEQNQRFLHALESVLSR